MWEGTPQCKRGVGHNAGCTSQFNRRVRRSVGRTPKCRGYGPICTTQDSRAFLRRTPFRMPKLQDLILLLSIFRGSRLEALTASMARLHVIIAPVVELLNDANMQRVTSLMKQLDQEYNDTIYKHILKLESYEKRMGDRYATALVLPPILVSPEEREEILSHMRVGACQFLLGKNLDGYGWFLPPSPSFLVEPRPLCGAVEPHARPCYPSHNVVSPRLHYMMRCTLLGRDSRPTTDDVKCSVVAMVELERCIIRCRRGGYAA